MQKKYSINYVKLVKIFKRILKRSVVEINGWKVFKKRIGIIMFNFIQDKFLNKVDPRILKYEHRKVANLENSIAIQNQLYRNKL